VPAGLLLIIQILGFVKSAFPDVVALVDDIASLIKGKVPEHAQRIEEILAPKGATADAAAQIELDIKAAGG
jgi:hypothetical protein